MPMQRLSSAILPLLPAAVRKPAFYRSAVLPGIVHLGIGGFHRAHQAVYTGDVLERGDLRWGTIGVSLRSPDTRDALSPQDCLYTLAARDASSETLRVIGGLTGILVAPENLGAVVHAMSQPSIRIVSLTVTEKGYCHDPATGALNEEHPDIIHDLRHPETPRTAVGLIAAALQQRRASGIPPFTVLCCDNLPANGRTVKGVLARFAGLRHPELEEYVRREVSCPCTMVDRIVPATTPDDRARISAALGCDDAWPVVTEPFTQWIIEDDFPMGRPEWAATFVRDVAPFELMKLRLLNGAHSSLAYLGYMAGYETVADAMSDPALAAFIERLMASEVSPMLAVPPGVDLAAYRAALLQRFRNPSLRHRTWQIAMDGTQKLPQRLLGTLRERLAKDMNVDGLSLGVAAWMRYVTGRDEQGGDIDVRDPMRDELRRRADAAGLNAERLAASFLGIEAVFGSDLAHNPRFVASVTRALASLIAVGARQTLEQFHRSNP